MNDLGSITIMAFCPAGTKSSLDCFLEHLCVLFDMKIKASAFGLTLATD